MPRENCRTSSLSPLGAINFPPSLRAAGRCFSWRSPGNRRHSGVTLPSFWDTLGSDRSPPEGGDGPLRWSPGTRSSLLKASVDFMPSLPEHAPTSCAEMHLHWRMGSGNMPRKGQVRELTRETTPRYIATSESTTPVPFLGHLSRGEDGTRPSTVAVYPLPAGGAIAVDDYPVRPAVVRLAQVRKSEKRMMAEG